MIKKLKRIRMPIFLFAFAYTFLMLFGSTWAWYTSSDVKENVLSGGYLKTGLQEVFVSPEAWEPSQKPAEKRVCVVNNGNIPAFVRISLEEFLLCFEVDIADKTGNGNLKEAASPTPQTIDKDDPDTWINGRTYAYNGKYYLPNTTAPIIKTRAYYLDDAARAATALTYMQIHFGTELEPAPIPAGDDGWFYYNGWFYYAKVLNMGEITPPLIESVQLAGNSPNWLKLALYKLAVNLDSAPAIEETLGYWGLTPGTDAYNALLAAIN